jgi:heat shock protein HslJ
MKFSLVLVFVITLVSCQAQKKNQGKAGNVVKMDTTIKDSIEYYNVEIEANQKNYLDVLKGSWSLTTMKRQARIDAENLDKVYLTFNPDMTFTGFAGCNNIRGTYILKGTGIKFENIVATKMACNKLEQETAFLKLLQETVSTYTVDNKRLLLRDGSSNIVFEGERKAN